MRWIGRSTRPMLLADVRPHFL